MPNNRLPRGIDDEARPGSAFRCRNWCFTINNWVSADVDRLRGLECEYLYCQPEIGESGTRHLQGFVQFTNPRALGGCVRLFQRVDGTRATHFEPMRGTIEQAIAYCQKEETRDTSDPEFLFLERGTRPVGQGKRTDLDSLTILLREGKRGRELFESAPVEFIKFPRGIAAAVQCLEPPRDFKTDVYWYYGSTGTGKSRAASVACPDAYWKAPSDYWWDGYEGHADVIIDDYRCDFCKFSELLRLFDRYPLRLPVKGSTVQFRAKRIFVTAPKSPEEMWRNRCEEDLNQLIRRITEIKFFNLDSLSQFN